MITFKTCQTHQMKYAADGGYCTECEPERFKRGDQFAWRPASVVRTDMRKLIKEHGLRIDGETQMRLAENPDLQRRISQLIVEEGAMIRREAGDEDWLPWTMTEEKLWRFLHPIPVES